MMEETTPRTSKRWIPHSTYTHDAALVNEDGIALRPTVAAYRGEGDHEDKVNAA